MSTEPTGRLSFGDAAGRIVSGRIAGAFATTTALKALPAKSRQHGQIAVTVADKGFWIFNSTSAAGASATVLVPDAGSGRWLAGVDADGTLAAQLALTTTGNGASLIGIEDAGGNYSPAATVEAALAELWTTLASTANAKGASKIGVEDAGGLFAGTDTVESALAEVKALADSAIAVVKRTCTIDFTADGFGALGAGVKTFAKNIGAALPANARLVGWDIAETVTEFDDAAHGNYDLELGVAAGDVNAVMTSTSVKAGSGVTSTQGTPGVLGFSMAPLGTLQMSALLTSSVDLNTVTAGSVVVNLFYIVLA